MPIVTQEPSETEKASLPGENLASIGHNSPPLEELVAMEFREALLTDRPDFIVRMEAAIDAVSRAAVTDDETLGKAGDLDRILRACEGHIAETHKTVKEPWLLRGRAVDAEKNGLVTKLTEARFALKDRMNKFMAEREAKRRAEEARIAAEQRAAAERAAAAEREREAAEAAARKAQEDAERARQEGDAAGAAAAAQAEREAAEKAREAEARMEENAIASAAARPKNEPVRSDTGSTVSGRKVWQSQVTDYQVAFIAVEDNEKVREAIDKAIAQLVKVGKRQIDGVRIWETISAVSR